MTQTLNAGDLKRIFAQIGTLMQENKDFLCKLDGALGDGDIGLTMDKGFRAVVESLETFDEADMGALLLLAAKTMGEKAASTMGTLMTTALLRAGKAVQGKQELEPAEALEMLQAMVKGLTDRGKAQVGDKTILDAFVPAVNAFAQSLSHSRPLAECLQASADAAHEGMKRTVEMQSRHGRAARYLEKSVGHQDPGATVGALFFRGFADAVSCR
ncbi:MAG: dihydroxyacetone kinase subunit DhaL [Clostridia bacterium]